MRHDVVYLQTSESSRRVKMTKWSTWAWIKSISYIISLQNSVDKFPIQNHRVKRQYRKHWPKEGHTRHDENILYQLEIRSKAQFNFNESYSNKVERMPWKTTIRLDAHQETDHRETNDNEIFRSVLTTTVHVKGQKAAEIRTVATIKQQTYIWIFFSVILLEFPWTQSTQLVNVRTRHRRRHRQLKSQERAISSLTSPSRANDSRDDNDSENQSFREKHCEVQKDEIK